MCSDALAVCPSVGSTKARSLRRVFLSARWQLLAMLNWNIEPSILEPLVPRGCELDFHGGKTFVTLVGFLFLDTRVLGVPVPLHRNFEEVNLRFYVRRTSGREVRRGVAFVKEMVPRWAIAQIARRCYNEPYVALPMAHEVTGPAAEMLGRFGVRVSGFRETGGQGRGKVAYRWRFDKRWNSMEVQYAGERVPLVPGSHEEFITEHYFGYCGQCESGTIEYQVEHPPWNIWPAAAATLDVNVAALFGPQLAAVLLGQPTSAFLADGSAVALLRPSRIA